jgi:hypothetical protein
MRRWLPLAALLVVLSGGPAVGQPPSAPGPARAAAPTSCLSCHANPDWFGEDELAIVAAMRNDVHAAAGVGCHDCHGGDPDPALAEDDASAMSPEAPDPFRGAPARTEIPTLCGRCHSDPAYMRRFRPDPRVDQELEYWTSHHGQALRQGDTKVATCVDCHGVHGIQRPGEATSPVHPTQVAKTCARCHADAERMAGYVLADGRPMPTDQLDGWSRSVHAAAMRDKGDLSAPTCNDCHGNHGATPPGVGATSFVCGQCHGREAELFRSSAKSQAFSEHQEMLADAGEDGCAACHDPPEPQASVTDVHGFGECATCHGNHAVVRPRLTMLAPVVDVPCALCHEPNSAGEPVVPEPEARRRHYLELRDELLAEAASRGLAGSERFDWLIDRASSLPTHTDVDEEGTRRARPEFARLFAKFRLGKTTVAVRDPATGRIELRPLRRCVDCHGPDDTSGGFAAAQSFAAGLQELTALIGRAERIVLAARRGGVLVGDAAERIDAAIDAQIQLQVLVHTFDPEGAFTAKHREGIAHASAALAAGQRGLDELRFRHLGLGVSLVVIALVLVGLALLIRQLPQGE